MMRVQELEARPNHHLWLRFDDGTEGVVDLGHLVGRGVFAAWSDPTVFAAAHVGEHGAPEWPGDVDLCPDALYMEITGKRLDELPAVQSAMSA